MTSPTEQEAPARTDADNVVRITPELVEDLKRKKIIRDYESGEFDLEAVGGSPILGELTEAEREVYVALLAVDTDLMEWVREVTARELALASDAVRESATPADVFRIASEKQIFKDDAEAEEFFETQDRMSYLKALFWMNVRHRLQTYATRLAVRAGYKVVRLGYKYKRQDD